MDATFLAKLKADFPDIRFISGERFVFRPPRTVVIEKNADTGSSQLLLLHEMGHAISRHWSFKTEVERLKIEMEAWEKARELCDRYGVFYDEEVVERELDTYREWLDKRSRCPRCGLARFQTPDLKWHCPACGEHNH